MGTYFLILTLMTSIGGGVTTLEIDGIGMCSQVGSEWVERSGGTSFYTCVKKPDVY